MRVRASSRGTWAARIGVVGALAVAAAACGSSGGASSSSSSSTPTASLPPSQLLSDASAKLVSMTSFRFTGSGNVATPASASAPSAGSTTVTPAGYATFTLSGAASIPEHLFEVTTSVHGLRITEIATQSDLYLHYPTVATPNATATTWLEIPSSVLPIPTNSSAFASKVAAALRAAVKPQPDGTATVDGQTCTLVKATISGSAMSQLLSAADPSLASQAASTLDTVSAVITAAINSAHELVQVHEAVSTSAGVQVNLTITYEDQNQPVSITIPPSNEVELITSAGELSGVLGGSASTSANQGASQG
ncbi:hypothetical protein Afer_1945 [Acidimicrobium ferrooxidans DSM 10331]|uniref:LppX_LprAFG lipoprotein n=1 Tax=Acidimicrobium ferrooxidans (strain DSM 10331 / JCM 15462 / NBRC 103882 / ICP) TaxID=525909 RepID=C7M1V2_ACIFD|nr:hypothetical protein [Acidimicrobium ferrooxidans]ACU54849.1 hypothetical protein Afer_1945 [Acidimicrobium ferrooxidans DSM 10331]